MPTIFNVFGYHIYFWSNENNEPIHDHAAMGSPRGNATKFWILASGDVLLAENDRNIPAKDIRLLKDFIRANSKQIVAEWIAFHGYEKYYA